ncbi:ras GEF [Ramaria rubella]|nr:ras GEF [Ramaria rubella]
MEALEGLHDLAGLAGIPGLEPAVRTLFGFYAAVENIKVYNEQCLKLRNQCVDLLLVLRDNGRSMVGTDYMKAVDEVEITIERVSRKARTWSSWNKFKALVHQSEIRQGVDDLSKDLAHCATRFNIMSHMEILHRQSELRMDLGGTNAEIQEKLQRLLDSTQDIHTILTQPEGKISDHMLNIQEAIYADVAEPDQRNELQERLLRIHRHTELLPPMIDLTGEVRRIGDNPVNISGGFSDVYLGEWLGNEKVALKLTRGINQTTRAQKRFINEVAIWRQLQHKNVARLYGVATLGNYIYTVSPWMEHRDALNYVCTNPNADRLKILCEVATGLEFLHKHGVVHGDLRGANILISDAQIACITDFGLSVILEETDVHSSATADNHGNSRWMAPELINPELIGLQVVKPNTTTDVWSYGMLCLEILTGLPPFHHRTRAPAVISDLINGMRPTRPPVEVTRRGLSDALWDLMQQCWHQTPRLRPSMTDIPPLIRQTSQISHQPPSPPIQTSDTHSSGNSSIGNGLSWKARARPIPASDVPRLSHTPSSSIDIDAMDSSTSSSSSPRQSNGRPDASGSNNLFNTSPRVVRMPLPASRSPPTHGNNGITSAHPTNLKLPATTVAAETGFHLPKKASLTDAALQGMHSAPKRPRTAGAAESSPRLPPLGELHDRLSDNNFGDITIYKRMEVSQPDDGTVVELSTKEASRANPLPTSSIARADAVPPRPVLAFASSDDDVHSLADSSPSASTQLPSSQGKEVYIEYNKDGLVVAATLTSLVDRLICESSDTEDFRKVMHFREVFLVCYRAFTDAEEVFNLLLERFETVSSPSHTAKQRASIRYSVLTVLDLWLRGYHVQATDKPLLERMRAFTISIQSSGPAPTIVASAQKLADLIDSTIASLTLFPISPSTPMSPTSSFRPPSSLDISPHNFARALTMLEAERYCKIIPSDFIGWLKGTQCINGISTFITENNRLSYWVQKSILKPDEQLQRSENLRFFLCVAEECRKLRNFSSSCAIYAGLASTSITSLKRTSMLDKSSAKICTGMEKLLSQDKNFQVYRKALNASTDPCLPWLREYLVTMYDLAESLMSLVGVHLHDVKVLHGSHSTRINQGGHTNVIYFRLYHLIHDQIRQILLYQDSPLKPLDDSPQSRDIQAYVESQFHAVKVNNNLHDYLQRRAAKLAREELEDFTSHRQELMTAGFIRST